MALKNLTGLLDCYTCRAMSLHEAGVCNRMDMEMQMLKLSLKLDDSTVVGRLYGDFYRGAEIASRERVALEDQGEIVGGECSTVGIDVSNRIQAPGNAILSFGSAALTSTLTALSAAANGEFTGVEVVGAVGTAGILAIGALCARSAIMLARNAKSSPAP